MKIDQEEENIKSTDNKNKDALFPEWEIVETKRKQEEQRVAESQADNPVETVIAQGSLRQKTVQDSPKVESVGVAVKSENPGIVGGVMRYVWSVITWRSATPPSPVVVFNNLVTPSEDHLPLKKEAPEPDVLPEDQQDFFLNRSPQSLHDAIPADLDEKISEHEDQEGNIKISPFALEIISEYNGHIIMDPSKEKTEDLFPSVEKTLKDAETESRQEIQLSQDEGEEKDFSNQQLRELIELQEFDKVITSRGDIEHIEYCLDPEDVPRNIYKGSISEEATESLLFPPCSHMAHIEENGLKNTNSNESKSKPDSSIEEYMDEAFEDLLSRSIQYDLENGVMTEEEALKAVGTKLDLRTESLFEILFKEEKKSLELYRELSTKYKTKITSRYSSLLEEYLVTIGCFNDYSLDLKIFESRISQYSHFDAFSILKKYKNYFYALFSLPLDGGYRSYFPSMSSNFVVLVPTAFLTVPLTRFENFVKYYKNITQSVHVRLMQPDEFIARELWSLFTTDNTYPSDIIVVESIFIKLSLMPATTGMIAPSNYVRPHYHTVVPFISKGRKQSPLSNFEISQILLKDSSKNPLEKLILKLMNLVVTPHFIFFTRSFREDQCTSELVLSDYFILDRGAIFSAELSQSPVIPVDIAHVILKTLEGFSYNILLQNPSESLLLALTHFHK